MPDHHIKGQPAAATYVREKGCIKCHTIRYTPCIIILRLISLRGHVCESSIILGEP